MQKSLNLSHNAIKELADDLLSKLPELEVLDVSFNCIDDIPPTLLDMRDLNATGNPLPKVIPAFRSDKAKVTGLAVQ